MEDLHTARETTRTLSHQLAAAEQLHVDTVGSVRTAVMQRDEETRRANEAENRIVSLQQEVLRQENELAKQSSDAEKDKKRMTDELRESRLRSKAAEDLATARAGKIEDLEKALAAERKLSENYMSVNADLQLKRQDALRARDESEERRREADEGLETVRQERDERVNEAVARATEAEARAVEAEAKLTKCAEQLRTSKDKYTSLEGQFFAWLEDSLESERLHQRRVAIGTDIVAEACNAMLGQDDFYGTTPQSQASVRANRLWDENPDSWLCRRSELPPRVSKLVRGVERWFPDYTRKHPFEPEKEDEPQPGTLTAQDQTPGAPTAANTESSAVNRGGADPTGTVAAPTESSTDSRGGTAPTGAASTETQGDNRGGSRDPRLARVRSSVSTEATTGEAADGRNPLDLSTQHSVPDSEDSGEIPITETPRMRDFARNTAGFTTSTPMHGQETVFGEVSDDEGELLEGIDAAIGQLTSPPRAPHGSGEEDQRESEEEEEEPKDLFTGEEPEPGPSKPSKMGRKRKNKGRKGGKAKKSRTATDPRIPSADVIATFPTEGFRSREQVQMEATGESGRAALAKLSHCVVCRLPFKSGTGLENHRLEMHPGQKLGCWTVGCPHTYEWARDVEAHIDRKHPGFWQCRNCGLYIPPYEAASFEEHLETCSMKV